MRTRKSRTPEPETLLASIEEVQQTYYISELRGHSHRVDDEATCLGNSHADRLRCRPIARLGRPHQERRHWPQTP